MQQAAPGEEPAVTVEHPPQALDPQDMGSLAGVYAWRGRRFDATGLCWLGARYYEPLGGRFLSADPLGHGSDMSLYGYAGGDPVNGMDPDGRLAFGFGKGYTLGSFAQQDNLAQAIGGIVGQFASYLTPGYGEVALLRDALYSAGQVGETLEDISENGLTGSNALRLGVNLAGSLPLVGAESRLFGALEHEVGAEAGLIEREIGTGLGETESLSGSLGEAEEAVERDFQEACESNTMCFVGGTPVATESGPKPIEFLRTESGRGGCRRESCASASGCARARERCAWREWRQSGERSASTTWKWRASTTTSSARRKSSATTPATAAVLEPTRVSNSKHKPQGARLRRQQDRFTMSALPKSSVITSTLVADQQALNNFGYEAAIRLPISEHTAVSAAQTALGAQASARDLLAQEIWILKINTKAPSTALQDLINLNKALHPMDYLKSLDIPPP